eukprot:15173277-Alexandrium_andersonii.AAC.1
MDLSPNAAIPRLEGVPRRWQLEADGRWLAADGVEQRETLANPASSSRAPPTDGEKRPSA